MALALATLERRWRLVLVATALAALLVRLGVIATTIGGWAAGERRGTASGHLRPVAAARR